MSERIVVSFWMTQPGIAPQRGRGYLERARALTQRAEALGATLAAWGSVALAFSFDADSLEEAVSLAAAVLEENAEGETSWQCGIAEGPMELLATAGARADLAWGPPLVLAATLARIAEPGDVLLDTSLKALAGSDLMTLGVRVAMDRAGRARGIRLDARQPWRKVAVAQVTRLETPPMVGREDPSTLLWMPGALAVLRADPGAGGTRYLQELCDLVAPGPCLLLAPAGSGLEPLGALRRALGRSFATELQQFEPELEPALHRLLAGDGVHIDTAASLIAAFLRPQTETAPPGALLIDDVSEVDAATLEACARAVLLDRSFPCVVRLDATSAPPTWLSELPRGPEMELKPLSAEDAEALAGACTAGAMDANARRLWARRGAYTPLGIVESVATAVAVGELAWVGTKAYARRRSGGKGKVRPPSYWIARRAAETTAAAQCILAVVTLLGGEVSIERIDQVLNAANAPVKVTEEVAWLVENRWLVEPQPGWIALPTRTHREAILGEFMDESTRRVIHRALAHVLEKEERNLGLAEAAHHAARAGSGERAARLALTAARVAAAFGLEQGATQLIAFAREKDPTCDLEARRQLASQVPGRVTRDEPSVAPDEGTTQYAASNSTIEVAERAEISVGEPGVLAAQPAGRRPHDSEPPTIAVMSGAFGFALGDVATPSSSRPADLPEPTGVTIATMVTPEILAGNATSEPLEPAPASTPFRSRSEPPTPANVGERLTELAKEALLGADTRSLERWTEGLLATGERGRFAERMQAIVRLSRGDIGDALRVLKNARAELEVSTPAERCQASLALGVALAAAGRPDEALLEGLDALARARETGEGKGALACLAFLAKLYGSVERDGDAARLRAVAHLAPVSVAVAPEPAPVPA